MSQIDQVIDHAAEMQSQIDQIWRELLVGYLTLLALCFIVGFMAFHVWQVTHGG